MVVEQLEPEHQQELYGLGTTEATTDLGRRGSNTQSSTADLRILQQRELHLITLLLAEGAGQTVRRVLAEDGYTLEAVLGSDVLHPVDSYNLIKRTARTWSKILASLSLSEETVRTAVEEARTNFPLWERSRVPVALGILNIHVYYRQSETLDAQTSHTDTMIGGEQRIYYESNHDVADAISYAGTFLPFLKSLWPKV